MPTIPNVATNIISGKLNVQLPEGFTGPYPPNSLQNLDGDVYQYGVPLSDGSFDLYTQGDPDGLLVPPNFDAWKTRRGLIAPGSWDSGGPEYLTDPIRVSYYPARPELIYVYFNDPGIRLNPQVGLASTTLTTATGLKFHTPELFNAANPVILRFPNRKQTAPPAFLDSGPFTWLPSNRNGRATGWMNSPITPQ